MNERNEGIGSGAADLVADLARQSVRAQIVVIDTEGLGEAYPQTVPVLFDAQNRRAISLKPLLEEYRGRPERREGTAEVETLQSFIALLNRHKDSDSAIFARTRWPDPSLTAVVDYHTGAAPPAEGDAATEAGAAHTARFGRHRIVYKFPVTDELTTWIKLNGAAMEQAEFAAFLEEHAAELSAPFNGEVSEYEHLFKERFATPAELIALSRDLEVHVGAKVKRQERLQTGERTVFFAEEHMNGSGEPVSIPGIFMVSVQAFLDGDKVRIPARLRYRIVAGGIKWFYQLYRWEFFLRDRIYYDMRKAGEETGLPTFEGSPEKAG